MELKKKVEPYIIDAMDWRVEFGNLTRKEIPENPLIARTLYYSKDMESFATGLKRIKNACDKVGCRWNLKRRTMVLLLCFIGMVFKN